MLVSSANSMGLANLLMVNERSVMCIRNSTGPNTEPCGTLCFTCSHLEYTLLNLLSFIGIL